MSESVIRLHSVWKLFGTRVDEAMQASTQDVLIALQHAANGRGWLAGLATLFCTMVIDRIVQGHYRRSTSRHRPGR